uniref:KIAA1755 n=1 Tax=Loxodonta africana TaxID=9785 RepID=G3TFA6_LOXAF
QDPPSLDTAIQHALAGLYPPFEATAPTVLGQVFRLLDSNFQGDGLNFLLDFLIPAKRLCEQVREAACAPYSHHLFLHEGWPLCLRNEVVVHLAPLNPLLLRQGDFYLQVEPQEEQSVCIVIKCLSLDLRTVDKKPIPESSYPILFTQEWLEAINSDFEGSPLHSCLVASENGISLMPWTKITRPEFVDDKPQAVNVLSPLWGSLQLEALNLSSPQELHQARSPGSQEFLAQSLAKGMGRTNGNKYPGLIKVEQARSGEVAFKIDDVVLEGDYVALLDFSQESSGGSPSREAETSSECSYAALEELSQTKETPLSQRKLPPSGANGGSFLEKWTCAKSAGSKEEPCILGLRRKVNHEAPIPDSERPPQEPYLEVLENPLDCASGLRAGVSEEPAGSRSQGSLGNPENMSQLRPGPRQASSPRLSPVSAPARETKMEDRTTQGHGRLPKHMTSPSRSASSSGSPTPGPKFSFLKGQRLSPTSPERVSLQHDQPWKVLCSLYSPKSNRAKPLGKAETTQTKTSCLATDSDPLTGAKGGFPEASVRLPERGPTLDEAPLGPEPRIGALSVEICHSRIACLPGPGGGRDRSGRPLLLVSTYEGTWEAPWCSVSEVTKLLSYLCTVPRSEAKTKGLTVVIDARKQPPHPSLVSALQATQVLVPASIQALLFLGEKEAAVQLETLPGVQVEVFTSLQALSHHVDPSQLPTALGGPFPYCHSEWVQFFQKLDTFLADLRQASSLLQASIEEFEKCDAPGGVQEAARCLSKSKELMEAVLRDPGLLGLQQKGGATLARLRQQASRLDFNPDVRSHLAEAAALYGLVDEQLHVLVTVSNHLLGKLELRVRLGRLEASIHQVSDWMEQEGSRYLQALTPKDGSLETVEKTHAEFEEFFLQAAAQYCRGLELSKQAAQLGAVAGGAGKAGEAGFPEMAAFATTQRAFQAKLTHFYMAAERQRTDLETLLHLHRFCKKMTWFHMDCQDLMTQLRLGKAQGASPGDQRRLHRYLQRLASEFPAEKLTAMELQVASLSWADLGQDLWEEARGRHEEIWTLLKKALAHCPRPATPTVHSTHPELGGVAAKVQDLSGDISFRRWQDPPLRDSLGMERLPKSSWPLRATRGRQYRNFQPGLLPQEAGQAVDANECKGPHEPLDPAPEHSPATPFSRQWLPRQLCLGPLSQVSHQAGGSFSSDGTDSQTSLEDSPQTSPPASL